MGAKLLSDHGDGRCKKHIWHKKDADNDVVLIAGKTQVICKASRFCVAQIALVESIEQVYKGTLVGLPHFFFFFLFFK